MDLEKIYNKVLVTGGTGFIGTNMRKYQPNWIYMSSKDCDITNKNEFYEYLKDTNPDAIIHLAARVGGIKNSVENQAEFLYLNNLINLNVIHEAYRAKIPRVLSCLSTCCFPDNNETYPLVEGDLLKGEPVSTNYAYAYAKRILFLQSKYYSKCYNVRYNAFTPSNVYGPEDNYDIDSSHFVASLVKKVANARDGDTLRFWGSGKPLRQQLFVDDLAQIIPMLLEQHEGDVPLIVAPHENLSIKEMINIGIEISGKKVQTEFSGKLDGQFRKDGSNKELLKTIGNFKFTKFRKGLEISYKWFMENK